MCSSSLTLQYSLHYSSSKTKICYIDFCINCEMQAENPCSIHQDKSSNHICLTSECNLPRMFCDACLPDHKKHEKIPYSEFLKKYYQFHKIYTLNTEQITKIFATIRDSFALCIKKAEQRILKQYLPSYSIASTPKLDQIQSQQLYGIVYNVVNDEKFQEIATEVITMQKFEKELEKNSEFITISLEEMNTSIMAAINKSVSQIQLSKINSSKISVSKLKAMVQNYKPSVFHFIEKYRPSSYTISEDGQCITRNTIMNQGLSMYAVVEPALSKEHDSINFTIVKQEKRFIYFGVCDRDTFWASNFRGDLYRMGNKMWAIRQSPKVGANSVCLHNSIQQFSNLDRVPFDYDVGDTITIKYDENKNNISFIKNHEHTFVMPLDNSIKQFYPFVGLKFNKDSVRVFGSDIPQKSVFQKIFTK